MTKAFANNLDPKTIALKSWMPVDADSDFSIQNIPFGIYSTKSQTASVCSRIGDKVIDLKALSDTGCFKPIDFDLNVFNQSVLNDFIALGKNKTNAVRQIIMALLDINTKILQENTAVHSQIFIDVVDVTMHLPVRIGDYTDFYSSIDHATNIGKMLRDPENALLPNWKHLPVGYHGRSSSIFVSGTDVIRPKGQQKAAEMEFPVFGPSKLLDFELETGFIIGKPTKNGESISTEKADDHIFGMVLFNDWSARDIQAWEYVPLGPFLAKNFASTISPWVVTIEALESFRCAGYEQIPKVLPYLEYKGQKNLDISLEVSIIPENKEATVVCTSNYKYMYWTMEQQLAHHTVNGCNVNVGDMMASGTISGPKPEEFGSMMELSWRGTKPIKMKDGSERKFINDLDTVMIKGYCKNEYYRIGFGECSAKVLPAISN
jgi:fumarylacetoacetase